MKPVINTLLDPIVNFGKVTVSTGYNSEDTIILLAQGNGSKLPDPYTDGSFNLVWFNNSTYYNPSDDPYVEIVRCISRTEDILVVIRGQESTVASIKNLPGKTYKMSLTVTAKVFTDIQTEYALIASPTFTGTVTLPIGLTGILRADAGIVSTDSDILDLIDNIPYAKLADGTSGNLITWDANGVPALVSTGTAGQVLTSTGAGSPPTFATIPDPGTLGSDWFKYTDTQLVDALAAANPNIAGAILGAMGSPYGIALFNISPTQMSAILDSPYLPTETGNSIVAGLTAQAAAIIITGRETTARAATWTLSNKPAAAYLTGAQLYSIYQSNIATDFTQLWDSFTAYNLAVKMRDYNKAVGVTPTISGHDPAHGGILPTNLEAVVDLDPSNQMVSGLCDSWTGTNMSYMYYAVTNARYISVQCTRYDPNAGYPRNIVYVGANATPPPTGGTGTIRLSSGSATAKTGGTLREGYFVPVPPTETFVYKDLVIL